MKSNMLKMLLLTTTCLAAAGASSASDAGAREWAAVEGTLTAAAPLDAGEREWQLLEQARVDRRERWGLRKTRQQEAELEEMRAVKAAEKQRRHDHAAQESASVWRKIVQKIGKRSCIGGPCNRAVLNQTRARAHYITKGM
jgi:hypothetical protein